MTDEKNTNAAKQPKKRNKRRPRAHGTGSVFQRKDRKGKQWVAQLIVENGRPMQRYFETQGEAADALNEMLYQFKRGTLITKKDQLLGQHVEYWLENVHKRTVRESTYIEQRRLVNVHILPALGHIKLQELTTQDIDTFYRQKQDKRLSASTIRNIHAVLRQSLSYAVRTNLVARNVCEYATLPRKKRPEIQPLTIEQAQQFIAGIRGNRLEALVTVALLTGMREGELLALHWSDVNLEQQYLQVRRTARRYTGQGVKEGEPKTESSRRKIILSPFLVDVFKQHRIRQLEARLQAGDKWEEHNLVFCNTCGRFFDTSVLHKLFVKLLKEQGLSPIRFHDLRHSAASILGAMGVPPKVVQELLGHSTIMTTLNVYSHAFPSMHEEAIGKMSRLFDQHGGDTAAQK